MQAQYEFRPTLWGIALLKLAVLQVRDPQCALNAAFPG